MLVLSDDGSYTAYSEEYNEHYHSTKDGALHESLTKHVKPALELKQSQEKIVILDICFGLGFNTLCTIYYLQQHKIESKIEIYSPELDSKLVNSLNDFIYPKEFESFKHIIKKLIDTNIYEDESVKIELFIGDAREYIQTFTEDTFDIVYQDAFSPSANPILWTKEYFRDISNIIKKDGILTTYSMALKTRLALHENGFNVYINSGDDFRDATISSKKELSTFIKVDMLHKISCNPEVKSLRD